MLTPHISPETIKIPDTLPPTLPALDADHCDEGQGVTNMWNQMLDRLVQRSGMAQQVINVDTGGTKTVIDEVTAGCANDLLESREAAIIERLDYQAPLLNSTWAQLHTAFMYDTLVEPTQILS